MMKSKADISTPDDIKRLIDCFYDKVKADEMLSLYFTKTNWKKHLPIMYTFWENIAFSSGEYMGNPMEKHQHIHKLHPLSDAHFKRWLKIFNHTLNELFEGKITNLLNERAQSIAKIMMTKITH